MASTATTKKSSDTLEVNVTKVEQDFDQSKLDALLEDCHGVVEAEVIELNSGDKAGRVVFETAEMRRTAMTKIKEKPEGSKVKLKLVPNKIKQQAVAGNGPTQVRMGGFLEGVEKLVISKEVGSDIRRVEGTRQVLMPPQPSQALLQSQLQHRVPPKHGFFHGPQRHRRFYSRPPPNFPANRPQVDPATLSQRSVLPLGSPIDVQLTHALKGGLFFVIRRDAVALRELLSPEYSSLSTRMDACRVKKGDIYYYQPDSLPGYRRCQVQHISRDGTEKLLVYELDTGREVSVVKPVLFTIEREQRHLPHLVIPVKLHEDVADDCSEEELIEKIKLATQCEDLHKRSFTCIAKERREGRYIVEVMPPKPKESQKECVQVKEEPVEAEEDGEPEVNDETEDGEDISLSEMQMSENHKNSSENASCNAHGSVQDYSARINSASPRTNSHKNNTE